MPTPTLSLFAKTAPSSVHRPVASLLLLPHPLANGSAKTESPRIPSPRLAPLDQLPTTALFLRAKYFYDEDHHAAGTVLLVWREAFCTIAGRRPKCRLEMRFFPLQPLVKKGSSLKAAPLYFPENVMTVVPSSSPYDPTPFSTAPSMLHKNNGYAPDRFHQTHLQVRQLPSPP